MGKLQTIRSSNLLVSNTGSEYTDGLYIRRKTLFNNKYWYFKDNVPGIIDFFIYYNTSVARWDLANQFTSIFRSDNDSANPWETTWTVFGNINVSETSLPNNKISIKKQNTGGGRIIIKRNNLFTCPFEVDTTTCPTAGLSNSGWFRGNNTLRIGKTTAPDGSNSAVIYQSINASDCFVSQGFLQYWRPFTTYEFSIWTKLIAGEAAGGNVINVTRNGSVDRAVLPALGNLTSEWKKFTITFTTGDSYNDGGYTTAFFAENFDGGTQVALWGAEMYINK